MTTIPARLAQVSRTSGSPAIARQRVLHLYRDWYRSVCPFYPSHAAFLTPYTHSQAPEIVSLYALNVSVDTVRRAVRHKFERNRYVTDPRVIDVLLLKNWQEYQETMNVWKMPDHVMGILLLQRERPERTFLEKFYEGSFRSFCCWPCSVLRFSLDTQVGMRKL
jgi:NADH dehydrogenase (ubiquinone) 1 alpha subcomplex subunit 6